MDACMWKKGGSEALSRATQSRLQMCRQQQCGCFGPHQAALGVSRAHVPTPPVNQSSQASGSTAATKTPPPGPPEQAGQRQTDADEATVPRYACNSFPLCLYEMESMKSYHPLLRPPFFFLTLHIFTHVHMHVHVFSKIQMMSATAQLLIDERGIHLCHKCRRLSSFSSTAARLLLCSLVSLAPGHSFNSTLLPIVQILSNIHRVLSHNYRFLLDASVCECVHVIFSHQRSTHN